MRAKRISGHSLMPNNVPLEPLYNRFEIVSELWAQPVQVRNPANHCGKTLKGLRVYGYSKRTPAIFQRCYPPTDSCLGATFPDDVEVIADAIDPINKSPLVNQTTQIVNLIPRLGTGPLMDRVLSTKWVALLKVSGLRNYAPHLVCRRSNLSLDTDRPFEITVGCHCINRVSVQLLQRPVLDPVKHRVQHRDHDQGKDGGETQPEHDGRGHAFEKRIGQ